MIVNFMDSQARPLMLNICLVSMLWQHCLYLDVAISAPFGDQPGTVYIYAGAGSDIINQNPIQVITIHDDVRNIEFVSCL